jgi:ATP-binding protein involved in chromosome partitioning
MDQISQNLINTTQNLDKIKKEKPKVNYQPKEGFITISYEGKTKKVKPFDLRVKCICAACVDEFTGNKILKDSKIPEDVHPTKIEEKGNYAVAMVWSDGHRSSIYPYKRLMSNDI